MPKEIEYIKGWFSSKILIKEILFRTNKWKIFPLPENLFYLNSFSLKIVNTE